MSSRPPSSLSRHPSQRPSRGSRRARSLSLPAPGPGPRPDLDSGRSRRSRRTGQLENWPDSEIVGRDEAGIEGTSPPQSLQSPPSPTPAPTPAPAPAPLTRGMLRPPMPSQPLRLRRTQSHRNPPAPWMGAHPRGIPMQSIPRPPQRRGSGPGPMPQRPSRFIPQGVGGLPPRPNFPGPMQAPYGRNPDPMAAGFNPPPMPPFGGPYGGAMGAGGGIRGVGPFPGPVPGSGPRAVYHGAPSPLPLRERDSCCHIL